MQAERETQERVARPLPEGTLWVRFVFVDHAGIPKAKAVHRDGFEGRARAGVGLAKGVLALVVIGYTLLRNVYPYPTDAAAWYPIIAILWVISGILLTFVRYAATQRAGERLMAEEGLAAETGSRTEGNR